MTTNENHTKAVRDALYEVSITKAPTKRAARVFDLLQTLPTQAEVTAFAAELRRRAGVQDVELLPETTWTLEARRGGKLIKLAGEETTTGVLRNTLADSEDITISWPSVIFHWGVMVTFTWGGVEYIARSKDYALTETYLSS